MKLTIENIIAATGGRLVSPAAAAIAGSVSTDSRAVKAGEFFLALRGAVHDGHGFVVDAVRRGAAAIIVEEGFAASFCRRPGAAAGDASAPGVIAVPDTLRALGDMALFARTARRVPVVAIGGTNGKTTTKEMTASILGMSKTVLKTQGNMNNLVGLPLTLLTLNGVHDAAVVELGINSPGEMKRLCAICRPDVSVVTNIGRGHLEGLGTAEQVAMEKLEIYGSLEAGGVRVVNLDDPLVERLMQETGCGRAAELITFSRERKADVLIKDSAHDGSGAVLVTYDVRGGEIRVRLDSPLLANAYNAAAAIAAALSFGAPLADVRAGLEAFSSLPGRMRVVRIGDWTVLDDTYNANPESLAEALRTLGAGARGRRVCVVGEMRELGGDAERAHMEAGGLAAGLGVDVIAAVGRFGGAFREGALSAGAEKDSVHSFGDNLSALAWLKGALRPGDTVLVKGSRGAAMEEVVRGLQEIYRG